MFCVFFICKKISQLGCPENFPNKLNFVFQICFHYKKNKKQKCVWVNKSRALTSAFCFCKFKIDPANKHTLCFNINGLWLKTKRSLTSHRYTWGISLSSYKMRCIFQNSRCLNAQKAFFAGEKYVLCVLGKHLFFYIVLVRNLLLQQFELWQFETPDLGSVRTTGCAPDAQIH